MTKKIEKPMTAPIMPNPPPLDRGGFGLDGPENVVPPEDELLLEVLPEDELELDELREEDDDDDEPFEDDPLLENDWPPPTRASATGIYEGR